MINREMMITINNSPEMLSVIDTYMENNKRKLRNLCHKIWHTKKIDMCDYDDLYDVAMECLMESVIQFDNKKSGFETFLSGNISRKTKTWIRDNRYRLKRNNLLTDDKGKLIYEEDELGRKRPIPIQNVFLDADNDESWDIKETLSSRENIEEKIFLDEEYTDKVEAYLSNLPRKQMLIARLLSQEYKKDEILEILHMTVTEFNDQLAGLKKYENVSILF